MTSPDIGRSITLDVQVGRQSVDALLQPGQTWRLGRSTACDLVVRRNMAVSKFALLLRYLSSERHPDRPVIDLRSLQRGVGRVLAESSEGHRVQLAAGSLAVPLTPGTRYAIQLLAPGRVAEIRLVTPAWTSTAKAPLPPQVDDTLTWSVAANPGLPEWVDVAALCVAIQFFPEVRPRMRNGKTASASETLGMGLELWRGKSSNDYRQQRLLEALQASDLKVYPGQDKQSRVATYYVQVFSSAKIRALADFLMDELQEFAHSEPEPR